jgi:DNA polymerase III delta subunit
MAVKKTTKTIASTETLSPKILDERLKSGNIGGIYCFFGEEEYMADYYTKKIMDCADAEDRAVFDPDNFSAGLFRDAVLSYPFGGGYKAAAVKNCDNIKFRSGEKEEVIKILSDGGIKDFACVIFRCGSAADFLKGKAEFFEFKINTPASLAKWIKNICASENTEISEECAEYILSMGERRMYPLRNEIDKLIRYAQSKKTNIISQNDIDGLLAKKTELEAFELTNAILDRNYGKAFESLEKLRHFKEEPVIVLGQISRHFCDLLHIVLTGSYDSAAVAKRTGMHEYKVRLSLNSLRKYKEPVQFVTRAVGLCRDCDIKLKSTQLPEYSLLENLIFNISLA